MCSTAALECAVSEQRDAYFTGRAAELRRVGDVIGAVAMDRPPASHLHVAVLGASGMGKTHLVSQALLKLREDHASIGDDVCFVRLGGRGAANMEQDLMALALTLGGKIGVTAHSSPRDALSKLKDYLSHSRFIAVVDDADADGLQAAVRWIPASSARHAVLVTSQLPAAALRQLEASIGPFENIDLCGFDECSSLELICKLCDGCSFTAAQVGNLKAVAARSQHVPLAVRLFGNWSNSRYNRDVKTLRNAKKSFIEDQKRGAGAQQDEGAAELSFRSDYLARTGVCDEPGIVSRMIHDWMSEADAADRESLGLTAQFPRALLATVCLALHELDRIDVADAAACRLLLAVLALCPPTTPWSFFLGHDSSCVVNLECISQRQALERIALLLHRSGLVRVDREAETFCMHLLLQLAVRHAVAGGAPAAVRLIDARIAEEHLQAASTYRQMLPAAYCVVKHVLACDAGRREWCSGARERIAALMEWLGGGLLEVEIRRDVLKELNESDDGPHYAACVCALGRSLSATGCHHEAVVLLEQGLALCQRMLPADHLDIATAMLNVAASYFELGRHAEALDLEEQALAFRKRVLPADHPDIATAMINAANNYSKLGRHQDALDLEEKALALRRRALPADHPDIATAMLNTATSYFTLCRHTEALSLFEQALEFCRSVLPADHPDIATAMLNTAISYSNAERHAEALDLHMQVLAFRLRVLPADHPDIATAMLETATSYYQLGRHAEALDLEEQALAFRKRVLPADHPDIATAMLNTAISYSNAERHAEALDLHMQVLALRQRALPADHPDIAAAMLNTASSYCLLNRYVEALDLNQQVLALRQRVLPADHPDVATAMLHTAISFSALDRHTEALQLEEQLLALRKRVLPQDHPDIASAMLNIASSYSKLGRQAEALDYKEQVLSLRLRALPPDHADIATAMLSVASSYSKAERHAEALDLHMQVLALRLRVLPADHPDIATALSSAASSYAKLGRHAEALDLKEQAIALRRRV